MEIDLKSSRVSMDAYDYADIVSHEEKEALKMELAVPLAKLLAGKPQVK